MCPSINHVQVHCFSYLIKCSRFLGGLSLKIVHFLKMNEINDLEQISLLNTISFKPI